MALNHSPFNLPFPVENQLSAGPHLYAEAGVRQDSFFSNGVAMPFTLQPTVPPQWGAPRPQEELGLSDTMSELAISDCAQPPPNKIRRRNALTIDDPNPPLFHFHTAGDAPALEQQLPNQPDAFERSFLLQRMEELQKRLGGANLSENDLV
jgi:hypothetical protein